MIVVALVGAYAITMLFGCCGDKLLLFPTTQVLATQGAEHRAIWVGEQRIDVLVARSHPEVEPEAFVLEFCGNATRAESIARFVADRWGNVAHVEVWVMNYPGYGQSSGKATIGAIAPAALATFDALHNEAANRPVFVAGNSLGTAPALYVAAHRSIAGLLLQNPPPLRQMLLGHYGWWNLWLVAGPVALQIPDELDSLANARLVHAPAVFISSQLDQTVPAKYQRRVFDAFAGEKRVINLPDGDHNVTPSARVESELIEDLKWMWSKPRGGVETPDPVKVSGWV